MALELALLTPVLVVFMMVMVGLGRVVEAQGQVDGAARDAARAASLSRSPAAARVAAGETAGETLIGAKKCQGKPHTEVDFSQWRRGGQVSVAVTCTIDLTGLSLIDLHKFHTMTGTATAPIDTLRRIE